MPNRDNRREFYRLTLHVPLSAQFKVIGYRKESVNSNSTYIYIVDISAGGLRMHSKLNLPVNEGLLLEFRFILFNRDLILLGSVVRKKQTSSDIFEYGVEFSLDEDTRETLLANIHMLSIRLKNARVLTSCSFISDEEMERFYGPALPPDSSA
ncbi:PilZ domain-containing protein [Gorillibacterium sp. sgz5001074]|uniref:PilZ domain-containing protein n=1 Tax=Gorillibacterium sp. sgz5001074 TaxID=3446695 RepID=UPI003F661699